MDFEITPEPFAPAQVIATCCDLLALRAGEAGITLHKMPTGELPEMIAEMRASRTSEREGRLIDHDESGSMEKKKQEGYF